MDTGGRLRYTGANRERTDFDRIRWRNAAAIFPGRSVRAMSRRVDVNAFIGDYPFRPVPGTTAAELWTQWTGGHRQRVGLPPPGDLLERSDVGERGPLPPQPWPARRFRRSSPVWWDGTTRCGRRDEGAAVRADPTRWNLSPAGPEMGALASACGATGLPLLLSVRLRMAGNGIPATAPASWSHGQSARSSGSITRSASSSLTPTANSSSRCISARRPPRHRGFGGTSAGSGVRRRDHLKLLLETVGVDRSSSEPNAAPDSRIVNREAGSAGFIAGGSSEDRGNKQ